MYPHFNEQLLYQSLYSVFTYLQVRGNLFIGPAPGDQRRYLRFPPGQVSLTFAVIRAVAVQQDQIANGIEHSFVVKQNNLVTADAAFKVQISAGTPAG